MKYIIYILVATVAGIVQTVSGFGSAVVLVLFFQNMFGMLVAPAIATSINLILTVSLALKYHKHIEWEKITIPAVVYTISNSLFVLVAKRLNLAVLKKAFGVFLILLAIYALFYSKKVKISTSKRSLFIISIISGITGGLFSVGGPILALYYSAVSKSKESYIGNMQFLFMLICITATTTRIATHIYTANLIPITVAGAVGVTLGKTAGIKIVEKLPKDVLNRIIFVFVAVSGAVLLF